MKRSILILAVAVTLTLIFSIGVSASDNGNCGADGSDVKWTFDETMGILKLSGSGEVKDYTKASGAPWAEDYADKIKIVSIDKNITGIGKYAFSGCSAIETIVFPDGITSLKEGTLYGCSSVKNIIIPNGVEEIGENAFYGCSSLEAINIPSAVKNIGDNAFWGCGALSAITVSDGNEKYRAESNCLIETETKTLIRGTNAGEIPSSVEILGKGAFSGCTFTSVTVPESIVYIEECVFEGCKALESITLPFVGDTRLNKDGEPAVAFGEENTERGAYLNRLGYIFEKTRRPLDTLKNVIVTDTEMIGSEAFAGCTDIKTVVLNEDLIVIGDGAFFACAGLGKIEIPYTVERIGVAAFSGCTGIEAVTVPDKVKYIGSSAFSGCGKLKIVTIGASVESIGNGFLAGCASLESLEVSKNNETYYSEADCIIEKGKTTLVAGCKNSVIPFGITAIGEGAFRNCIGLTEITLPSSVAVIEDYAFYNCTALVSVKFPEKIKAVGDYAFAGCVALSDVKLSKDVEFGASVFENCVSLKSDSLYVSQTENAGGIAGGVGLWIALAVSVPIIAFGGLYAILVYKKRKNENNE